MLSDTISLEVHTVRCKTNSLIDAWQIKILMGLDFELI